jgi:hypothetical protein
MVDDSVGVKLDSRCAALRQRLAPNFIDTNVGGVRDTRKPYQLTTHTIHSFSDG